MKLIIAIIRPEKLEAVQEVDDVLGAQVLAIFAQAALAVDLVEVAHLELDAIRARRDGAIDHVDRPVEAAVVVVADLGDDVGAARADLVVVNLQGHLLSISVWFLPSRTVQARSPSCSKRSA